tara:strand:+ start:338 stop:535 length:198 start_codon:yes stop_codon:yes gene_type:complete
MGQSQIGCEIQEVCVSRSANLRWIDLNWECKNRPFWYGLDHQVRLLLLRSGESRTVMDMEQASAY